MLEDKKNREKKREVNWITVMYYIHIHVLGMYGLWMLLVAAKWMTVIFTFVVIVLGILGQTAGAHRLWAHNSYKASSIARLFLMLAQTLAGTGSIHHWVIDHRIHHHYYGTDKDPHNHQKGFWYSHVLSNLLWKHPDHEEIVKPIDHRDLETDWIVWYQQKLYVVLFMIVGLLLPVNAPVEYWDEDIVISIFVLVFFRLAVTRNAVTLINSGPLIWGLKSTDKYPPDDNLVFYLNRNFWPSYHYFVPWDYKTGEYGTYDTGLTNFIIKLFYELGLAWEFKTNTAEELREALYKLAMKRVTQKQMLRELKDSATYEAIKSNYAYYH